MKISKIVYAKYSDVLKMPHFDMSIKPRKQKFYLRPVTKLLSYSEVKECNTKINKISMENINGPYIALCNHNSFVDFKVFTEAIYPRPANYIVAIDGFINREGLLRNVGCICKRKFLNDINVVKQIKYSLDVNKYICAIYPEARYSHVGTTAILPDSLGKMVKMFGYPVVTFICHGNHLRQPVWNLGNKRKVDLTADMTCILQAEETKTLSISEINERIQKAFIYNDYDYQINNNIKITESNRAEGLERVLYKCPHCQSEEDMVTKGTKIICERCNVEYELSEFGKLECLNSEAKFATIPEWYEWERLSVKKEVEEGKYQIDIDVDVDDLRNSKGFYRIGRGKMRQTIDGIEVIGLSEGEEFVLKKNPLENYSVHVEYAYFGRGDAVSFSTINDSYYMFPVNNKNIVTKIHFGTEEIYKYWKNKNSDITKKNSMIY